KQLDNYQLMAVEMLNEDTWNPAPPPIGEDKAWREVEKEKEWSERAKDMSIPSLSALRTGSFGGIAPSLLQRKDSTFESRANPWDKSLFGDGNSNGNVSNYRSELLSNNYPSELFANNFPTELFASTAAPAEMFLNLEQSQFDDSDADTPSEADFLSTYDYSDTSDAESAYDSQPRPKLNKRRSSILSLKSLPRVFEHEPPNGVPSESSELSLEKRHDSANSSTSTLVDTRHTNGDTSDYLDSDILEGLGLDPDSEELSPETSITFYQGFRALHPKMAVPNSHSSPSRLGLGLNHANEITLTTSFRALPRAAKPLPDKARLHAASINNIARIFSELLNERDAVIEESDKLQEQRLGISDDLRQIEDLLNELGRRKQDLTTKLKNVVAREEKVNDLLEELDGKIGSIGDESQSFERTVRTLKGYTAPIAAEIEDAAEPKLFDAALNSCFRILYGHTDSVECLDFDMPFGTLVTGSADKTIRVWDLSSHRCAAVLQGHTGWVRTVQSKGQVLMSGSGDHTIRQWNLSNLPPLPAASSGNLSTTPYHTPEEDDVCVHMFRGHTGGVGCLMFDDQWLVSGSVDKTIRQWDRETGNEVAVLRSEKWVDSNQMDKADRLLIGDFPAVTAQVGDRGAGTMTKKAGFKLYNVGGHVGAVQFWRHALAAGYGDGVVRLWDLRTGKCHRELTGHTGAVTTLKFDQNHVISGSVDKTVKVWDLRAGESVDQIRFEGSVNDLHHDMFRLCVAGGSKDVQIYNRTTSAIKSLEGHTKPVRSVRHMDDTLITGGMDTTVRLWRI
ncbi:Mitochondrial fission protein, partial [Thoreauomyces humboldtii]